MELLEGAAFDKDIEIAVLAGNKSDFAASMGIMSGPSDGLVFVDSALHTAAMTEKGARLLARDEMPVNHLELVTLPAAWEWVEAQLGRSGK